MRDDDDNGTGTNKKIYSIFFSSFLYFIKSNGNKAHTHTPRQNRAGFSIAQIKKEQQNSECLLSHQMNSFVDHFDGVVFA